VIEELLAVVAQEHEQRVVVEAAQALVESRDLDVHGANRAVIPAFVVLHVRIRIEARLLQLVARRHAEVPHQRFLDELGPEAPFPGARGFSRAT